MGGGGGEQNSVAADKPWFLTISGRKNKNCSYLRILLMNSFMNFINFSL